MILVSDPERPDWLALERGYIEGTRRGDRAAFAALYRALSGPLYRRVLLPRLGQRDAAEEALAETFRIALERLGSYADRGGSIYGWLATIGAHVAADVHRKQARSLRALTNLAGLLGPLMPEGLGEAADAPHDAAERERALSEATARVLAAINPRYRRAIELRFFEGRERAQCADAMEVRLGTFDVLLLRALRAFRESWLATAGAPPEL